MFGVEELADRADAAVSTEVVEERAQPESGTLASIGVRFYFEVRT
jgi:hypothetical protein